MFDSHDLQVEQPRFQWVLPFLIGLVCALLIAACVAAAYVLKMGPFASTDRQAGIEGAIVQATDEIRRQIDQAAFDQLAAAEGTPQLANQGGGIKIGDMQFGPTSAQAQAELASAEARGLLKCDPILATLDPTERAALQTITCEIQPALPASPTSNPALPDLGQAPAATATAPSSPPTPAQITLKFKNGQLAGLAYALLGDNAPTEPVTAKAPPMASSAPEAPSAEPMSPPPEVQAPSAASADTAPL